MAMLTPAQKPRGLARMIFTAGPCSRGERRGAEPFRGRRLVCDYNRRMRAASTRTPPARRAGRVAWVGREAGRGSVVILDAVGVGLDDQLVALLGDLALDGALGAV